METISNETILKLKKSIQTKEGQSSYSKGYHKIDVPGYLQHYQIAYTIKQNGTGTIYRLNHCVFDSSHTTNEASIIQDAIGKLYYQCFHNSCKGRTWVEARELISGKDSLKSFMPEADRATENDITPPFDLSRLTLGKDIAEGDYPVTYIVDKVIPEKSNILFYAKGGSGKSTVATQMAAAIMSGTPFMGMKTIKRPVVIIDYENPLAVLSKRLKVVDGAEAIYFWPGGANPPQLNKQAWKELKSLVLTLVNPLIIIDTLSSACSGLDILSNGDFSPVMQRIVELRNCGATIIIMHHTPKQDETKYIGASCIYNQADHILAMYPVKTPDSQKEMMDEDDAKIYRLGTKDKTRFEPFATYIEFDEDKSIFVPAADPDQEVLDRLLKIIEENAPVNQTTIINKMGASLSQSKVKRLLKRNEGRLWRMIPGDHNAHNYSPIQFSSFSSIYSETTEKQKSDIQGDRIAEDIKNMQIIDNNELFSYSKTVLQTEKTEVIDVLEVIQ